MSMDFPRIDPNDEDGIGWWTIAKQYVLLRCPRDHTTTLHTPTSGHAIADDGTVSPSVVCPHPGCDFHESIRLLGWQDQTQIP